MRVHRNSDGEAILGASHADMLYDHLHCRRYHARGRLCTTDHRATRRGIVGAWHQWRAGDLGHAHATNTRHTHGNRGRQPSQLSAWSYRHDRSHGPLDAAGQLLEAKCQLHDSCIGDTHAAMSGDKQHGGGEGHGAAGWRGLCSHVGGLRRGGGPRARAST